MKIIPIGFAGHIYSKQKLNYIGSAGAGKDTIKSELRSLLEHKMTQHIDDNPFNANIDHFIERNLADSIKEILQIKFGLTSRWFEQDLKNKVIPTLGYSPRQLAQLEGTEYGRSLYGDDVWINSAIRHVENSTYLDFMDVRKPLNGNVLLFVGDIRHDNEANWCRDNGILIHINRYDDNYDHSTDTSHTSEQQLECEDTDLFYWNDTDINLINHNLEKSGLLNDVVLKLRTLMWPISQPLTAPTGKIFKMNIQYTE